MALSGGVNVADIALNIKRKLNAEGIEGIELEAGKKPKKAIILGEDGVQVAPEADDDDEEGTGDFDEPEVQLPSVDDLEAIEKFVDEAPEGKHMDEQAVRGYVLRFEKAVNSNVKMRSKFPNNPEKFMDSEVALDESIASMKTIAAYPELFGELVNVNAISSLLSLMPHENTDIGISVVSLLHDFLDEDNLTGDDEETAGLLVDALLKNNGLDVLVNNLNRLDEKHSEDTQAVNNTLEIFENLVEARPELAKTLALETKLLKYLCQRISKDGFDPNKMYASEILSVLLQQGDDSVHKAIGEGTNPHLISILKVIAKYRRRDPSGPEETEFVENLFNALCFALHENADNQARFAKAEGLQLMIAILRKKKYAKHGALKSIDFALQRCQTSCEKFVDLGGLKALFAIFMKRSKKKDAEFEQATEEHTVSIIAQLFLHLSDVRYYRLLRKFQESDYQKVERLLELQERYAKKVAAAEEKYRLQHPLHLRKKKKEGDLEGEVLDDSDEYMRKMENGLFTLQSVCFLIGFVVTAGDKKLCDRVMQLLHQSDSDIERVRRVLLEYSEQIGDPKYHKKLKTVLDAIIEMLTPEESA